ncbi:unnamed protein product, partial [marine sediment metagenome]
LRECIKHSAYEKLLSGNHTYTARARTVLLVVEIIK